MKVLVIGSGGREHALVWKIAQSPLVDKVYCAPGNPGTGRIGENINIKVDRSAKCGILNARISSMTGKSGGILTHSVCIANPFLSII